MERISFQGRNLATAHRIWLKMLEDDVTIFLGMAGALSAGGLRLVVAHLIADRYVDCLVSTGANLYHDLHETRGQRHYVGSAACRRRGAGRGADRSRLRHLRERGRVRRQRQLDCRLRGHPRAARLHDAGVPLPARRPPLEDDRPRRHPDRGLPRQRADLLPGDRRLVDRDGPVAGATEGSRASATSTSSATSSSRRTSSSAGRGPRRSCSAAARRRTSSTRRACRPSSTARRSAGTATRCRSSPTCRTSAARRGRASRKRRAGASSPTDSAKVTRPGRRHHRPAAARVARSPERPRRCWRGAGSRSSRSRRGVMTIDGQTVPHDHFEEVNEPAV